jgi:hypothetical protein
MLVARIATIAFIGSLLAGCAEFECTLDLRRAIDLHVRPVLAPTPEFMAPFGTITEGDYVDSLRFFGLLTRSDQSEVMTIRAGEERPGRYAVALRVPNFAPWDTAGVQVDDGGCHVETVTIEVRLTATP